MSLDRYHEKRHLDAAPESPGHQPRALGSQREGRFVVQRHRATALHYDLRLELGGVLVSWAVPKGPSLDPAHKRLAVHVEDHPLEYFDFEGLIPRPQYGGGDVIVWDWGRWTLDPSIDEAQAALHNGELKFRLEGEKLRGAFVLIRTTRRTKKNEEWLLIHRRDGDAIRAWDTEDHPRSVKSGRTNDDMAIRRRSVRPRSSSG